MWLRRRPAPVSPAQTLTQTWLALTWIQRLLILCVSFLLGFAMPVMGISLLLFITIDTLRWWSSRLLQSAHSV